MTSMDGHSVSLEQAIEELRQEIENAQHNRSQASDIYFRIGSVELELSVELRSEASAKAGLKFWVVEAGAEGKLSNSATHTVRVALTPVTGSGGDVWVSDSRQSERPE